MLGGGGPGPGGGGCGAAGRGAPRGGAGPPAAGLARRAEPHRASSRCQPPRPARLAAPAALPRLPEAAPASLSPSPLSSSLLFSPPRSLPPSVRRGSARHPGNARSPAERRGHRAEPGRGPGGAADPQPHRSAGAGGFLCRIEKKKIVSTTTKKLERPGARTRQKLDLAHGAARMVASCAAWRGRRGDAQGKGPERRRIPQKGASNPGGAAPRSQPFPGAAAAGREAAGCCPQTGKVWRCRTRGMCWLLS